MKISKIIAAAAASAAFAALLFSGAAAFAARKSDGQSARSGRLKVVATIFPAYDWTREIMGSLAKNADLTLLLDNGVDLHSFQPSAKDIARVGSADVFIHVGGESDGWVEDTLKGASNPNLRVVNLMEAMGSRAKAEEIVEGMEHEHDDDDHDHDGHHHHDGDGHHHHDDDDDDEVELDEHVWLSLRNASHLCLAICDALCDADPANAAAYRANAAAYARKLDALDGKFAAAVKAAPKKTLLFGDRFPFRYLVDDYGLSYYAAFTGCSAETEASFKTIIFLSGKLDALSLGSVCTIEKCDGKIARSVVLNSKKRNASIVEFDSMQSTTARDVKKGATYVKTMEKNLDALKKALK